MRHTISILVDNESGVLSRISGLFSARGFNIESLCVAEAREPGTSRITLVTSGDPHVIAQVVKRFNNMVNVIEVNDLTTQTRVEREMVLVRVDTKKEYRAEILRIVDIFRAKVVDKDKLTAFIDLLAPMGISEIARTGTVALKRDLQNKQKEK